MRGAELVRENTDAPIVKSGEVWNLLGAQITQHQKSAAALPNTTFCDDGNTVSTLSSKVATSHNMTVKYLKCS